MTHLNDLSKAYLDQIAEKKKDDTYLEPDMKKRQANNEKARKDMEKMGTSMKNPHFEEKKLDPVGQEDADIDNDGDVDSSDKYLKKRRKAIGKAMKKESFVKSDWRTSISEVMTDIESQPIKEKKVKNKIKINPTMGEAIEEIGGTLIEEIEVEDLEDVIECVYGELIEEGYTEDEVESAIEQALTEATVTMGHDSYGPQKAAPKPAERTRDKLKKKAKGFLGKVAVKAYNKAREAKAAATPAVQRAKTSAKRGIRKMAQKVVDRMSEEIMDEAVYGGTKKPAPTDKRLTVTNADKAGNTPAYQRYKAGDKNYKAADHMKEGVRDVDPEKGTAERKARLEKKRGMKMDDHPQYKKEEVEQVDEADSLAAMAARREKRLAAQRKKMGTSSTGQDFGHDHGISSAERKKRQQAEFDKFVGKKTQKEEASMSPQELQLQKKKARIDRMIAQKRQQDLSKEKSGGAQPAKAMGEEMDCSHNPKGKNCPVHGMDACPTKAMGEGKELSIDQQMKISREANAKRKPYQPGDRQKQRAAQIKQMAKNAAKDTRTDAQKMTDATGPRPGSRYRGD